MSLPLEGLRVLITRPQPQANRLADFLQGKGAKTTLLPMVEIRPVLPAPKLEELSQFHKVIAISVPAVEVGFQKLTGFHPDTKWFTPGKGTAKALREKGIHPQCPESEFTSESMLELPALKQVEGDNILILKGEGGRDLLTEELTRRGARVVAVVLYRRQCPDYSPTEIETTLASADINAIVATSGQIISNIQACVPNLQDLILVPLIVPSPRVARQARKFGFKKVVISPGAGDQDIAEALLQLVY
ncbi:uroporphyrinogen-III synthase [Sansalvadorimonas verongulae]|uniref:uroporphyrinogen-III synthase n=1 Tax=Sansalvadorimonas verongulae TaxID=2172824 RepID=UPI0012BBE503|nr:uroporphyrinogen-III synthase [Sansalvadorimonas verongulae]MTI15304.1 uroporphyrinogen-III synthase [Sansalvadorimonas verongulae]